MNVRSWCLSRVSEQSYQSVIRAYRYISGYKTYSNLFRQEFRDHSLFESRIRQSSVERIFIQPVFNVFKYL